MYKHLIVSAMVTLGFGCSVERQDRRNHEVQSGEPVELEVAGSGNRRNEEAYRQSQTSGQYQNASGPQSGAKSGSANQNSTAKEASDRARYEAEKNALSMGCMCYFTYDRKAKTKEESCGQAPQAIKTCASAGLTCPSLFPANTGASYRDYGDRIMYQAVTGCVKPGDNRRPTSGYPIFPY